MKQRIAAYVLLYTVGPFMAEWWAAIFTIGFGLALACNGFGLSMGVYQGSLVDWFAPFTLVFALCLVLAGLMTLDALHKGKRWLFLCMAVLNMIAMLWIAVFYLMAVPSPTHAVWVYFSHATLQALIFVRAQQRMMLFWHEQGRGDAA